MAFLSPMDDVDDNRSPFSAALDAVHQKFHLVDCLLADSDFLFYGLGL